MEGHTPADVSGVLAEMPTYAALTQAIRDTVKSIDTMWERHKIKFGAQDDEWATEWRPRTGFPLVAYQRRWEALRLLAIQPDVTNEDSDENSTGGDRQITGSIGRRSLLNVAQQRAILYLKSNPGPDNAGPNMGYHSKAKTLASGSWPYGLDHAECFGCPKHDTRNYVFRYNDSWRVRSSLRARASFARRQHGVCLAT